MRASEGSGHKGRSAWLFVIASATALASGLLCPQAIYSDASGCTLFSGETPGEDANCDPGGDGCYQCEYSTPAGYTTCAESPDGKILACIGGLHAKSPYAPPG